MQPRSSPLRFVAFAGFVFGGSVMWAASPEARPSPFAAFLLPAAIATIDVLTRGLMSRAPGDLVASDDGRPAINAIMLRLGLFIAGVHAIMLAGLVGWLSGQAWAAQLLPVMLGVTIVSVGNLLPRTRPNLAIGIRTSRTLSDRAVWMRTHRLIGYVVVALGVSLVLGAAVVPPPIGTGLILVAGPIAAVASAVVIRVARAPGPAAHLTQ